MKKIYLIGALGGLLLASCANDDLVVKPVAVDNDAPISFNMKLGNQSRATTSYITGADVVSIMPNFGVWAIKLEKSTDDLTALTLGLGTTSMSPNVVMNNYKVEGSVSGSGASATASWTYENVNSQFLKYWDGSYDHTYFFAYAPFAASDATNPVVFTNKDAAASNNPSVTFPAVSMNNSTAPYLYSLAQKETNASHITSATAVPLTFKRVMGQIKVKVYEAIAGYDVEMASLTFVGKTGTYGVAAIPATFDATATPKYSLGSYVASGTPKVVYSGTNFGTATLSYGSTSTSQDFLNFALPTAGTNIGESFDNATLLGTVYNVLPSNSNSGLQFVMNFTLKSKDTKETINVKGARVFVDPLYTNWEANKVYTYVFRITHNTSGTTNGDDPDPEPKDEGDALYPIVFDNLQIEEMDKGITAGEWDVNPDATNPNPHSPDSH